MAAFFKSLSCGVTISIIGTKQAKKNLNAYRNHEIGWDNQEVKLIFTLKPSPIMREILCLLIIANIEVSYSQQLKQNDAETNQL